MLSVMVHIYCQIHSHYIYKCNLVFLYWYKTLISTNLYISIHHLLSPIIIWESELLPVSTPASDPVALRLFKLTSWTGKLFAARVVVFL